MLPDEITIDGMAEEEFRRSIETMLRNGQADEAAIKLKALVNDHAGEDNILAARFLTIKSDEITLGGWDRLADQLKQYDRAENRITAIGVDIADPEDAGVWPDEDGKLAPFIETNFFSDSAYPFSVMDRQDLLDGYTMYGCEWQGNYDQADSTLSVQGIDDLYGSIVSLEMEISQYEEPPADEISAGALGACYLAVLIHIAVRDAALNLGLPRPMCLLAGSSNAYPFFDSPVLTLEEYDAKRSVKHEPQLVEAAIDSEAEDELQPAEMASLESLTMPRKKVAKKMALMVEGAGEDYSPIPEAQITSEPSSDFVGLTELDNGPVQPKSPARSSMSEMISIGEKSTPLFVNRSGDGEPPKPAELQLPKSEPLDLRRPDSDKIDRSSETDDPPAPPEIAAQDVPAEIEPPVLKEDSVPEENSGPDAEAGPEADSVENAPIVPEETVKARSLDLEQNLEADTPPPAPVEPENDSLPDVARESTAPEEITDSAEKPAPLDLEPDDTQPGFGVDLFADQPEAGDDAPDDPDTPDIAESAADADETDIFELEEVAETLETDEPDSAAAETAAPDSNERLFDLLGLRKEFEANKRESAGDIPVAEKTPVENAQGDREPGSDEQPEIVSAPPHPLRAGMAENPQPKPDIGGPPSEAVWRQLMPTAARWIDTVTKNSMARRIRRWFS